MPDYLLELRFGVRRLGEPLLVAPEEIPRFPLRNFRSVYAYLADDMKGRGVKDMEGVRLYSNQLFVDIDKDQNVVDKFRDHLISSGIGFELWHTGRRGGHFVIEIEPMEGVGVHRAQAAWVKEQLGEAADMTLYKPTGQWRLPGTVHEKQPGQIKHLILKHPGTKLHISETEQTPPTPTPRATTLAAKSEWIQNLTRVRNEGQRSMHIFILCNNCWRMGMELDEATEMVLWWNARFADPPHADAYVKGKVESVYHQLARNTHG